MAFTTCLHTTMQDYSCAVLSCGRLHLATSCPFAVFAHICHISVAHTCHGQTPSVAFFPPPLPSPLTKRPAHEASAVPEAVAPSLLTSVFAAQSQQDFQEHWRNTAQYYFGSSSQQLYQGAGRGVSIHPSQAARQRQTGSRGATPREPRPYYYRVQQQMQAGLANQSQRRLGSFALPDQDCMPFSHSRSSTSHAITRLHAWLMCANQSVACMCLLQYQDKSHHPMMETSYI